jgi:hypothetical protein
MSQKNKSFSFYWLSEQFTFLVTIRLVLQFRN